MSGTSSPRRQGGRGLNTILGWFLVLFIAAEALGLALPLLCINAVGTGVILPADACEESVGEYTRTLMEGGAFRPGDLPSCSTYMELDKDFHVRSSDMDADSRSWILDRISRNGLNPMGTFVVVPRDGGYLVIAYQIGARYARDDLNRRLPSPETVLKLWMALNGILVALVAILLLGRYLRRGVEPMDRAVEQISSGNLDFSVGSSTVREFDQVLGSMEVMRANLRSSLESQWRLQEEGRRRTAALAHDLKTPLTGIACWADLLGETDLDADQSDYLSRLVKDEGRMEDLTASLIQSSLDEPGRGPDRRPCKLGEIVDKVTDLVRAQVTAKAISLEVRGPMDLEVNLDPALTIQALGNVVVNAVEHTPRQGGIGLGATIEDHPRRLVLAVEDSGPGFTRQDLELATEQSYMGDPSRSGRHFGLGLSVAKRDAQVQSGGITLGRSDDLGGAMVSLCFGLEEEAG